MSKNLFHSLFDDREVTYQPEDMVIQPDLPPILEEDSMTESINGIEDDFNDGRCDDNTSRSGYNSSPGIANPSFKRAWYRLSHNVGSRPKPTTEQNVNNNHVSIKIERNGFTENSYVNIRKR